MPTETDTLYFVCSEQLKVLFDVSKALHSGNDRERDLGHKLWLVCNEVCAQEVGTITTPEEA